MRAARQRAPRVAGDVAVSHIGFTWGAVDAYAGDYDGWQPVVDSGTSELVGCGPAGVSSACRYGDVRTT